MKEFKINIQDKEIIVFQDDDGCFIKPEIVTELEKQGTATKPAHEPICMARKPLECKSVAENCLKWGTGGINIDESRVGCLMDSNLYKVEITSCNICQLNNLNLNVKIVENQSFLIDLTREIKNLFSAQELVNIISLEKELGKMLENTNKQDIGCSELILMENIITSLNISLYGKEKMEKFQSVLKSIILMVKKMIIELKICNVCINQIIVAIIIKIINGNQGLSQGRFPSNLLHDNSEEVRECFPETKKGSVTGYNWEESGQGNVPITKNIKRGVDFGDSGNASRFFKSILYYPKASKSERNKGCEELPEQVFSDRNPELDSADMPQNRSGNAKSNFHPTIKPIALMEYLIKMVTPKGGVVLDTFAGSGTTLVSAKQNGFKYIGIEMTEEYIPIIEARLKSVNNLNGFFKK